MIDNKEVISRLTNGLSTISPKQNLAPEYDLWAETCHLQSSLPFKMEWTWISVHQDTKKIKGKITHGPLTREGTVNYKCDKLVIDVYLLDSY